MKIRDKEKWQRYQEKNTDLYGGEVIVYAERWANLMELHMEEGSVLVDVAEKTSHEADTSKISGFMYGAAVSVLASVWEHGEELRVWHNSEYNLDAGVKGVVNPAIIQIRPK